VTSSASLCCCLCVWKDDSYTKNFCLGLVLASHVCALPAWPYLAAALPCLCCLFFFFLYSLPSHSLPHKTAACVFCAFSRLRIAFAPKRPHLISLYLFSQLSFSLWRDGWFGSLLLSLLCTRLTHRSSRAFLRSLTCVFSLHATIYGGHLPQSGVTSWRSFVSLVRGRAVVGRDVRQL